MPDPLNRDALPFRLTYGLAVLIASWYAMMAVHELGHILAAWATGGTVQHFSLPLLGFSRTGVSPNPRPLLVAWAGPVAGALLPLLLWLLVKAIRREPTHLIPQTLRFFVGFCLLANGVYLGLGWIDRIGDAGDLLRDGAAIWHLIAFGIVSTTAGLWIWHGLGPWFGMGTRTRQDV